MKIWSGCILSFLLLSSSLLCSQSTVMVEPGRGTIEQAILNANPGDILQLTGGGIYTLSLDASTFGVINMPLTLQVEPGATEKAIISLGEGASLTKKYYFFTIGDGAHLTLKGLDIHGILDDTVVASSMIVFDARPDPGTGKIGNFRFENCVFHDFKDYLVHGMKDAYARGLVQDSVFISHVTAFNAKHFLQYKHVSLRHLEMVNSTVYSLNGMALKIGKIGYRTVPGVSDPTITPTGFIDHCTLDDLGDIHGHIQVDDPYHLLTISNCIISNQQQYDQPPVYFTDPAIDLVVSIRNTCFWEVGPPNSDVGGSAWTGYEFSDTIFSDPGYLDADNGDFTLPDNSPLLTLASDGGQIGDLRWSTYPTTGITKLVEAEMTGLFRLESFPNPFHNSVTIGYRLNNGGYISVKIYSVSGKEMATLVDEVKRAGIYTESWHPNGLTGEIYLCRIFSGGFSETRKLIFQKP